MVVRRNLLTGGAFMGTTGPILEEAATCHVPIDLRMLYQRREDQ